MAYNTKFESRKDFIENLTARFNETQDAVLPYRSIRRIYIHSQEEIDLARKADKRIFTETIRANINGKEIHQDKFFILGTFEDFLEKAI